MSKRSYNQYTSYSNYYNDHSLDQLIKNLCESSEYDPSKEPSVADTIHSWSPDLRGSSDNWYISDGGFVSFSLTPEPESEQFPEPPRKRQRIIKRSQLLNDDENVKKQNKKKKKKKKKKKTKNNKKKDKQRENQKNQTSTQKVNK